MITPHPHVSRIDSILYTGQLAIAQETRRLIKHSRTSGQADFWKRRTREELARATHIREAHTRYLASKAA